MSIDKQLIVIQGPTACGKTALAIQLAQHFNTEIISADSRQFYREMTIGTAKPDTHELQQAPHHFINSDSIHHLVTASEYEERALQLTMELFQRHDRLILVGGSGLFIDALVNGLDPVPTDDKIREKLNKRFEKEGVEKLAQELVNLDLSAKETIDLQNPMRVIRALEVFLITGKPFSSFKSSTPKKRPFQAHRFAIDLPRTVLYDKINLRVDKMLEKGLLDEAKKLSTYSSLKALQTVGYQEFFDYFNDEISYEEAVELIKRNSRRYAKRQLTWLRRTENLTWLESQDTETQVKEVLKYLT